MTGLLAVDVSAQVVFSGAMRGLVLGVLAVGVILVYRSSRVINFALGELGALGAALLVRLVVNWHWNYGPALVVTVVAGALLGGVLELTVVRRLFRAPRVVLFVATLGAAQLFLFLQYVLPDVSRYGDFPTPFERSWDVGGVVVRSEHVLALVIIPLVVGALAWFLNRSRYGLAVRASADNPDAARLSGISVKAMSTMVWTLAGALATLTIVLAAPMSNATTAATVSLGPGLLLRTLTAALIARMHSFPIAVVAGIGLGIFEAVLFVNNPEDPGLLDAALLVIVLVTVLLLGLRQTGPAPRETWSFAPRVRPVPKAVEHLWWVRRLPALASAAALLAAVVLPLVVTEASRHFLYSQVLVFALLALSLTVLTGWTGQLSLGQVAFLGLGAMTTYSLVVEVGLAFPSALLLAALLSAVIAVLVGTPALRMTGLYLAVTTLALAVAAPWLLTRPVFTEDPTLVLLPRQQWLGISLASQRSYYYLCLGTLAVAIVVTARIRRSGWGRTMLAVRDNEAAAAALGLSPTRTKLTAFALSGFLAGLAGGLFGGLLEAFEPTQDFLVADSLSAVAIAVIGGLASITGTVLGALLIVGFPAFFPDSPEVALLTSGVGILVLLLYLPGGLVQILYGIRDLVLGWVAARRPAPATEPVRVLPTKASGLPDRPELPSGTTALVTQDVRVCFGPRVVVDRVTLEVARGEVVGLIGANGAGKSTLMNAIGGFVPAGGRVEVFGTDVSGRPPHRRAAAGLGRSFQGAELFGDLTVAETVATALEARGHASLVTVALGLPKARRLDRAVRAHADEILDFLGLGPFRERFISELSTGTRRIVELGCLMAVEARLLCLDEPTAGIAQRESEAFGPLLLRLRQELSASLLVIEHDMPLVMAISDRIYCLEAGVLIAEGPPGVVRTDSRVIASYLGTDKQAIARSGAAGAADGVV
jgi:ABC-type branched-subunit amino acid transport system permease subunit/ABC-type branched-subunit amino acid transport system ATPase component